MTKEEWKKAAEILARPYGEVHFKIDGYDVKAQVLPEKPLKYCIAIFVNDKINFKWAAEESDIRQRFYNRHKRMLISQKELKKLKKNLRQQAKEKYKYMVYTPFFNSFKTMRQVFLSNNKIIEMIGDDIYGNG